MKKIIISFLLVGLMLSHSVSGYGDEYKEFDIKYGMHKKIVNKRYGEPILVEKMGKTSPIPKQRALYKIDDSNYMIIYYFSKRIYKITLLQDMDLAEAKVIFERGLR